MNQSLIGKSFDSSYELSVIQSQRNKDHNISKIKIEPF
jgi:hypothetical protein